MTWILGITVGAIIVFAVVIVRSFRYVPSVRPNYQEKELTSTAYDYNRIPRKNTRFHIKGNGTIVKRELCSC
jgi:hypothetical protein